MTTEIHGFCEDRFLPLKQAMAANFADGLEVGASMAMTHQGRPVVDLWAGHADGARTRPWERNTIVVLYSTTKIALFYAFLILVDRGQIDLDAPVASYWPEFAAGGKGHVTVRQAMTHRSGAPGFEPPVAFEAAHDWNAMTANIAAQAHWFEGRDVICYHPVTIGFILGEIMARVDGRRPAQFLREEITDRAGIDFQIGLKDEADFARVAQLWLLAPIPALPGGPLVKRVAESSGNGDWATPQRYRAELPSSNGYGNGRSIARLCAIGAMGGELDGVRYLSQAIIDQASTEQASGEDPMLGLLRLGLGFGLDSTGFPAPTPSCFHWGGAGGSVGVMDQKTRASFGYAMNNLILTPEHDSEPRFRRMWDALGEVMAGL